MTFGPSRSPAIVLVVEDEMVLRMRAVGMVEDAGYTPLEARDTDEALAILSSRSDIALVCADIQLPGSMDGIGIAHTVRRRRPAIVLGVAPRVVPRPRGPYRSPADRGR